MHDFSSLLLLLLLHNNDRTSTVYSGPAAFCLLHPTVICQSLASSIALPYHTRGRTKEQISKIGRESHQKRQSQARIPFDVVSLTEFGQSHPSPGCFSCPHPSSRRKPPEHPG
jgi:hypothetical protein